MEKIRLDLLLVANKLVASRSEAQSLIISHQVLVNEEVVVKAGTLVNSDVQIRIKKIRNQFVSRGGYKLQKALQMFQINISDLICLDIGSSTGGFTDCMLQNNAQKVYSLDVGTNQLVWKLRIDKRVIVMENTNFRYVTKDLFLDPIQFCAIDVAFISLTKIIPVLAKIIISKSSIICLIKPQFESHPTQISRGGVVKEPKYHQQILTNLLDFFSNHNFSVQELTYSPIVGNKKGNIEYLVHLIFNTSVKNKNINVELIVNEAFNFFKKND